MGREDRAGEQREEMVHLASEKPPKNANMTNLKFVGSRIPIRFKAKFGVRELLTVYPSSPNFALIVIIPCQARNRRNTAVCDQIFNFRGLLYPHLQLKVPLIWAKFGLRVKAYFVT